MSKFSVHYKEKGSCKITHRINGTEIVTDLPPEYGGNGRSFSSTDLVSAAVGSCVLTTIDSLIERNGHDPKSIEIAVEKELAENPKMIKSIRLEIRHPDLFSSILLQKLERAMATCPVKKSLNTQIEVKTIFKTGGPDL